MPGTCIYDNWMRLVETAKKYHLYGLATLFIILLVPVLFTPPQDEYLEKIVLMNRTFLKSEFCLWMTVSSLFIYLPACLEILLDMIASRFVKSDIFTTLITRVWIVVGSIGVHILLMKTAHATGSVGAYYTILSMRGVLNTTAFLHLMHLHCKQLYTKRWTTLLMVLICSGTIVQCYAIQGKYPALVRVGAALFGTGLALFFCTIVYHFVQEYNGKMHHKSTIGYEVLFVSTTIAVVCVTGVVGYFDVDNQEALSFGSRMGLSTLQSILVYIAVTHEFKWDFSAALATLSTKAMFVRFVSHEVRTPLNSCILGLEYLESICMHEEALSPSVIVSLAKEIRDSCDDAVEIMNNLLLYEKVDGDALSLSCASENMYHIVQKVYRSFQLGALKLGVQTLLLVHPSINGATQQDISSSSMQGLDIGEMKSFGTSSVDASTDGGSDDIVWLSGPATVYVDRPKIHVVLRNMVSNAIKFSVAHGQTNGKVIVSVDPIERYVAGVIGHAKEELVCDLKDATYVRVSVQDNGPGISVENQRQMFGSIVQFDQNKLQGGGGSGMGLYISKKIVTLHEGCKIEVYSKGEGCGSTLSLYVPLIRREIISSKGKAVNKIDLQSPRLSDSCLRKCFLPKRRFAVVVDELPNSVECVCNAAPVVNEGPSVLTPLPPPPMPMEPPFPGQIPDKCLAELGIIVADDAPSNRRMLIRLLQRNGIGGRIEEAVDGIDFLKKMGVHPGEIGMVLPSARKSSATSTGLPLCSHITAVVEAEDMVIETLDDTPCSQPSFDLCIVDDNMPGMNGSEAVKHLRAVGYEGIIVGVTGESSAADHNRFRSKGADFVFTKPMRIQELVAVLNTCLHKV